MKKPDCFGRWWEAIPGPAGDSCRRCVLDAQCLARFAATTLPAAQEHLGATCGLVVLAEQLEVAEQAVLIAMAYTQRPKRPRQTPVTKAEKKTPGKAGKKKAKKKMGKKRMPKKKASKRSWTWGKKTHEARWNRERENNPLIAQLTPGMKIQTMHKDQPYGATVRKNGYLYAGQVFPTLSTLTTHIAGGSRNSVRFWGLGEGD